jgi:hypothetical protein
MKFGQNIQPFADKKMPFLVLPGVFGTGFAVTPPSKKLYPMRWEELWIEVLAKLSTN